MNETTNYGLSQIVADDKPTWLVMYNSDMSKIDAGMHEAKASADDAQSTANTADGKADANAESISELGGALESAVNTLGTVQGNVNTLNELMGSGTPTTSNQTVIGAINALEDAMAHSEDGDSFANTYSEDDIFIRGGTLYKALRNIPSDTAWSSLTLNTDYGPADRIIAQIKENNDNYDELAETLDGEWHYVNYSELPSPFNNQGSQVRYRRSAKELTISCELQIAGGVQLNSASIYNIITLPSGYRPNIAFRQAVSISSGYAFIGSDECMLRTSSSGEVSIVTGSPSASQARGIFAQLVVPMA